MSAFDESPNDPRRILIDQWNETHPANQVSIVDVPGDPDEQHDIMAGDAARTDGEADLYVLDNTWMSEFIHLQYIRALDESLRTNKDEDFFRNVLATSRDTYGGRAGLWGLPLNSDGGLLFKRSDVPGLDTPGSWDDYMGQDAAATFMATNARPEIQNLTRKPQSASAAQFGEYAQAGPSSALAEEILTVTALEAIWAEGGGVVNRDGKLVLDQNGNVAIDNRAQAGMAKLAAAVADKRISLSDAAGTDEDGATKAFQDGRSLFMRNWPIANEKLPDSASRGAIPFEISDLPHDSVLGGQNLAIAKSTDKPRAAQALSEFLTSSASQLILFQLGGFAPSRPTVYQAAARPYKNELRESIEDARPRPVMPCYTKFSREFRNGVVRALRNNGKFEADFSRRLAAIAACRE